MTAPSVTDPVPKRADQLMVGDRIQPGHLPAYARSGEGVVRYVELYHYRGADWVFAAFATADGDRNCAHYLPDGKVLVIPGGPIGHDLSRPADGGEAQPVAGRIPPHTGAVTEGGLVEVPELTGAAVTSTCVFMGDVVGWCETHRAVHIASGEGECGCPVYPFAGRGDTADTIIDHGRGCAGGPF